MGTHLSLYWTSLFFCLPCTFDDLLEWGMLFLQPLPFPITFEEQVVPWGYRLQVPWAGGAGCPRK